MLNSEIRLNSVHFPEGFVRDFDAHIYYPVSDRKKALSLQADAISAFANRPIFVGSLIDQLVGPHLLPMFEINFPRGLLPEIKSWLMSNRGELSVLVHEVTGDDPRDHSLGAMWLGDRLELDWSKLDPSPGEKFPENIET